MKKYIFRPAAYLLPVAIVMTVYFTTPDEIILTENAHYSAYPNGFVKLTSVEGEAYVDTETVGVQKMRAELFGAVPIEICAGVGCAGAVCDSFGRGNRCPAVLRRHNGGKCGKRKRRKIRRY